MDKTIKRKFTGELHPVVDSTDKKKRVEQKQNRNAQKKALEAYLKGKEYYYYGIDNEGKKIKRMTPQEYDRVNEQNRQI